MAGFAVALGEAEISELTSMMEKMSHRGPMKSGSVTKGKVIMAQNCLRADGVKEDDTAVPLTGGNGRVVCYDGQMGNWTELAKEAGVPDGDLREERLVLELYDKKGADMFDDLGDTIFSLVISDGEKLIAARDLLGIKTLFYGRKNGALFFSSELKGLAAVTDDINEFPAGCYMDESGEINPFAELPDAPPPQIDKEVDEMVADVRAIIEKSVRERVDFSLPTSSLLSGGIDSSVIAYLCSRIFKEKFGPDTKLKTYSLGVGESQDIINARLMSEFIDSEHHELIVGIDELIEALPTVIYHLENFDPSLVRSSVSNYLISRLARQHGAEILLSGEGGDEVFCGYMYLKEYPEDKMFSEQIRCLSFLHSNASLRLDRMNQCNSIKVVAPLISGELLNYALTIPYKYKMRPDGDTKIEKWIFRKTFEKEMPEQIVWRLKQEFSQGSGSADALVSYFDEQITDGELADAQKNFPIIRSKEELYYFRIFTDNFGSGKAVDTVGQWETI